MVIGILQIELTIPGAESLKDKRRVVKSLKDRLHREHMVSIAEVDALDTPRTARLGLAVVGREGRHIGEVLDRIDAKLRSLHDAQVTAVSREHIHGAGETSLPEDDPPHDEQLDAEMLRRASGSGEFSS